MRTVFQNQYELCKKWVEQSQDCGRCGNISFDYDTIFSYRHWPMARFACAGVVLFRNQSYSRATLGHQSRVRAVLGPGLRIYHVPSMYNHGDNVRDYLCRIRVAADLFWSCRDYAEYRLRDYVELVQQVREYIIEFQVDFELPPLFGLELSGLKAEKKLKVGTFK